MQVTIIRSDRKTIGIQINPDLTVTVRAPRRASRKEIERILREKEDWIVKHIEKMQQRQTETAAENIQYLTNKEIRELADKAKAYIPERVKHYAGLVGVTYGRTTIRNQKTRWGSCSSKGNLNFNCLLMLAPPEVTDYVVVHELCHRKQMNHSKAFWNEVEKVIPEYKKYVKWLKTEGGKIMIRMG